VAYTVKHFLSYIWGTYPPFTSEKDAAWTCSSSHITHLLEFTNGDIRIWDTSPGDNKILSSNAQEELPVQCGDCPMREEPPLLSYLRAWVNVLAVYHMAIKWKQKSLLTISSMEVRHCHFIWPLAESVLQQRVEYEYLILFLARSQCQCC